MKKTMKQRIQKACCRLLGDRTGAVMMEYVILAVMVAAAVLVAVMLFSSTIRQQLVAMAHAVAGQSNQSATTAEAAQGTAASANGLSQGHQDRIMDAGQ
jgi:Flp pilus assembly pilin Flp